LVALVNGFDAGSEFKWNGSQEVQKMETIRDSIELVCVSCKRIDSGNWTWLYPAGQSNLTPVESLCPACCRKRFPQFYSAFERPAKIHAGELLGRFTRFFRPG
jgi:hypothetical protein